MSDTERPQPEPCIAAFPKLKEFDGAASVLNAHHLKPRHLRNRLAAGKTPDRHT